MNDCVELWVDACRYSNIEMMDQLIDLFSVLQTRIKHNDEGISCATTTTINITANTTSTISNTPHTLPTSTIHAKYTPISWLTHADSKIDDDMIRTFSFIDPCFETHHYETLISALVQPLCAQRYDILYKTFVFCPDLMMHLHLCDNILLSSAMRHELVDIALCLISFPQVYQATQ